MHDSILDDLNSQLEQMLQADQDCTLEIEQVRDMTLKLSSIREKSFKKVVSERPVSNS